MLMHRSTLLRLLPLTLLAATLSCGSDGGGSTGPTPNPVPTLTSLSRDTAMVGAPPFVITLRGTGFVPGIQATIGGAARTTVRSSDTVATVQTVAADLATATTREVRVINPEPGGGASGALTLTIHPVPAPILDSISPGWAYRQGSAFTLHLHGSGFQAGTKARWNGNNLTTTVHSATHLSAPVTMAMLGVVDTIPVTAFTPAPGGGTSVAKNFIVSPRPPTPAISGVTPFPLMAADDTITLTIRGEHFLGADTVWLANNGVTQMRFPSTVTDSSLQVTLDRSVLQPRSYLTVAIHALGGTNVPHSVFVFNRQLSVLSAAPDTLDASQAADTLIVTGVNVTSRTKGMIGNIPAATELIDGSTMRLYLSGDNLLNTPAHPWIRLYDEENEANRDSLPGPVIRYPVPVLDSAVPDADSVGGGPRYIFIDGSRLSSLGTPRVNGAPREIDHDNSGPVRMRILLEASDLDAPDTLAITFENPSPGGGISNALQFAVVPPHPAAVVNRVDRPIIPSDSGNVTITLFGTGFIPGTVVEIADNPTPESIGDPLPTTVLSDTSIAAIVPVPQFGGPRVIYLRTRAPAPTAGPSFGVGVAVMGPGVNSARIVDEYVVSLAGDPTASKLHALVVRDPYWWILTIDPSDGTVLDSLRLGGAAAQIALAADASIIYLAAGAGGLVALSPATLDTLYQVSPGLSSDSLPLLVSRLSTSRSVPGRVAMLSGPGGLSPSEVQVAVVEDGALLNQRAILPSSTGSITFDFADGDSVLVGVTANRSSGARLYRLTVSDSGVTGSVDVLDSPETGDDAVLTGGVLHIGPITALNAATGALVPGSMIGGLGPLARGRSALRAYSVRVPINSPLTIGRHDESSATPVAIAEVPVGLGTLLSLTVWGTDGFAVGGSGGLLIGRSTVTTQ